MPQKKTLAPMIPLDQKPLLTVKECSELLGIGVGRLQKLASVKDCDYVLFVGSKKLFKREALLKHLLSSRRI